MKPEEINKISKDFLDNLNKIKNALSQLETDAAILQTGDANGPYWNGNNAYNCINRCLSNVSDDQELVNNLEKCLDYIQKLS